VAGIYAHFRPDGLDQSDLADFDDRFATRATRLDSDAIDHIRLPHLRAAVIDHGRWPSGGAASDESGQFLLSGSCWLDADNPSLADTGTALKTYAARRRQQDLEPLRGLFALAHASADGQRLAVETDRFGTVPMYYREDGRGGLKVASEIKFLVEPGRETPDIAALADLLAISYQVRQATVVQGITRLPLHHRLEFGPQGLTTVRLPQPGYPRDIPVDADSLEELDRLAARHLQRYAEHVPRLSIALSGGLDSRLLLYSARRLGIDIVGFTAGERGNVDVKLTSRLADHLGLPLVASDIDGSTMPRWLEAATWLSEGRTPFNHIHYFSSLFAGVTPTEPQIHGLIGEAVIGGYLEHEKYRDATGEERRKGCLDFANACFLNWSGGLKESILSPDLGRAIATAHQEAADELLADLGFAGSYSDYLDFRFVYRGGLFGAPALTSQVTPWTDVISPFLDADFFDFGARLRSEDLDDRAVQLRWGLDLMPGFADLPRVKDGMLLDVTREAPQAYEKARQKLLKRNRRRYIITRLSSGRINPAHPEGFPHYAQWYRRWGHVRRFVDGILLDERTAERGLWQADGLRNLLSRLRSGRNLWGTVGAVLMCEFLCRQLVDGDLAHPPVVLKHPESVTKRAATG